MTLHHELAEARDARFNEAIAGLRSQIPDDLIELAGRASRKQLEARDVERIGTTAEAAFVEAWNRQAGGTGLKLSPQELGEIAGRVGEKVKEEVTSRQAGQSTDFKAALAEGIEAARTGLANDPNLVRLALLVFKLENGPAADQAAQRAVIGLIVDAAAHGWIPSAESVRKLPPV